jgi:ABC-type sulfate transport system substrate-binding protein
LESLLKNTQGDEKNIDEFIEFGYCAKVQDQIAKATFRPAARCRLMDGEKKI